MVSVSERETPTVGAPNDRWRQRSTAVSNILAKLGVSRRAEAAAEAVRLNDCYTGFLTAARAEPTASARLRREVAVGGGPPSRSRRSRIDRPPARSIQHVSLVDPLNHVVGEVSSQERSDESDDGLQLGKIHPRSAPARWGSHGYEALAVDADADIGPAARRHGSTRPPARSGPGLDVTGGQTHVIGRLLRRNAIPPGSSTVGPSPEPRDRRGSPATDRASANIPAGSLADDDSHAIGCLARHRWSAARRPRRIRSSRQAR